MSADISQYLALITSEHNQRPKFRSFVSMMVQPFADNRDLMKTLVSTYFDLDTAVGKQLDTIGLWVGISRVVRVTLTNLFMIWDTASKGWDGTNWGAVLTWETPCGNWDEAEWLTSPVAAVTLDDDHYRILIRAKIAADHWDGTIPGAYEVWDILFAGTGYSIEIVDNGDMTMQLGLIGPTPDPLTLALFEGGYMDLRPAGVMISNYYTHTHLAPPGPST